MAVQDSSLIPGTSHSRRKSDEGVCLFWLRLSPESVFDVRNDDFRRNSITKVQRVCAVSERAD